jgi:hypothetical protein
MVGPDTAIIMGKSGNDSDVIPKAVKVFAEGSEYGRTWPMVGSIVWGNNQDFQRRHSFSDNDRFIRVRRISRLC